MIYKGKLSQMKGTVDFGDGQVRLLNLQMGPPYLWAGDLLLNIISFAYLCHVSNSPICIHWR